MEWVETTGKTIEEAKDAALDRLGIDESDAEFEVLEEPRLGLFGRTRGEARVRARVRPTQPRPKDLRRDRPRRGKAPRATDPPSGESAPSGPATGPAAVPATGGGDSGTPRPPKARRAARERPADRAASTPAPSAPALAPTTIVSEPQGVKMDQDVPLHEQAEIARGFLVGLLAAFQADGKVDVHTLDEDTMELAVDGGTDLHLLIGPGGATLTAVQEITRRVVQRQTGARNGRLLVDVSGYRRKRSAALARFTEGVAAGVRDSGVAKALEPMHAADRKVVHDTVNGLDGVTTSSEGEEPRRRVVISPS